MRGQVRGKFGAGSVGGFSGHVTSVFFLHKKSFTNAYEKFVAVRNA